MIGKMIIMAPGAAGLAAKQLCSLVFVCGLDPEQAKMLYIDKVVYPLSKWMKVNYIPEKRRVKVTVLGFWSAIAEVRDGVGATLITQSDKTKPLPTLVLPKLEDKPIPSASSKEKAQRFNLNAVNNALERAFAEADQTLAVAVLHRGKLVAERYAQGISPATRLPGWSMAKSITATLIGLLVKRGQLDVYQPGVVPEWRCGVQGGDQVSLDHLLRMTSGLDLVEDQSGSDPNTRLLFMESDAAAFAAQRGLKAAPGTHWEYMSGSTVLACRAIFEAAGGTLKSSQSFYREALFKPLGAASFVLEPDAAGTFIGSSYALATTHDWAKFGQLYMDDGVWEGERLLPEGWRDYVTQHTPLSKGNSYGAGFWTSEFANIEGLSIDLFYANGFQGQYVIMIPSLDLVIVRLGASLGPTGIWTLVRDLISAKK